ncbi:MULTISPECIES: sulfate adenylyltransferase subunit 1 [Pseudarthrobacter]|jgi:sulfate adenylyltransferase subunit 1|uniref:sulfate adenylyltransferase n=1 Tax=Pseudarthrobacter oxydans TaxID=1671 RepID=A0AAW8N946_PSEOX|nr:MULTISPECIES: GTP-binding protein [Pseudarthrobacter]MDV2976970.1 GTP-binding protein [Actinomycetes bacterium ARC8]WHP58345.1 GTP-binding protein [Arthrobacter sp. KFRI-F3372]MDR6791058.1 sulfate adenylyltransferase subunit 1 [Pseudarthrobacter oxydans]MDR7162513.1 sulfate adenylyltransferase subunit 1 [Pseudarthrobacter oxydans]NSX37908.1 50S ribosome-binding GTPase [Pseudarthrobacter oxydans]
MSTDTLAVQGLETALPTTLFRFATAGSVDDGKSTLVGRLLHDSKAILADTLDAVARTSADRGFGGEKGGIDLALLTDGLRAEREQGITIDVAYRYFATDRRSFILADCPGHVQYTKNTVTGASTADAVVVLIDARKGVLEQTRRHLSVLQLLRVAHVIVAVNKIDLVDFSESVFRDIEADVQQVGRELGLGRDELNAGGITDLSVIPVSALDGDNVVERSERTPWYTGPALLEVLETLPAADELESHLESFRFPVQLVVRPQGALAPDAVAAGLDVEAYRDYRAYAGQITEGSVKVGDQVSVLTPGQAPRTTTVVGIDFAGKSLEEAAAPQSVAVRLADEFDVARGDTIAAAGTVREATADLYAALCWLSPKPLREGQKVLVKHGTRTVQALVRSVSGKLDLASFKLEGASSLELNDIGHAQLRLAAPLPLENYLHHRRTGAFLVIDPLDGNTLAAGLVKDHPGDHEDERYSI